MDQVKFYTKGLINGVLLSTWFWDFLDKGVKYTAGTSGIVLTIFLIIKAAQDIKSKKLENKLKELEIEKKHQELGDLIQANKRKHG